MPESVVSVEPSQVYTISSLSTIPLYVNAEDTDGQIREIERNIEEHRTKIARSMEMYATMEIGTDLHAMGDMIIRDLQSINRSLIALERLRLMLVYQGTSGA